MSAREAHARAMTYCRTGCYPLFGEPADERQRTAFAKEEDCPAAPLYDPPAECLDIQFEDGATLPAVFARPPGAPARRPTVVHVSGYDSNIQEMFVAHAAAATQRGYNILLFDGPGQGRPLLRDGLAMRPDWENVVRPVVDYVLRRPDVDPDWVVLAGWSFGGFLAARAAAFEDRVAASWADPGHWDMRGALVARPPLPDEEKARFPDVDPAQLKPMETTFAARTLTDAGLAAAEQAHRPRLTAPSHPGNPVPRAVATGPAWRVRPSRCGLAGSGVVMAFGSRGWRVPG